MKKLQAKISQKRLEIGDSIVLGAYRKVANGGRMVTSSVTSLDYDVIVVTPEPLACYIFDSS